MTMAAITIYVNQHDVKRPGRKAPVVEENVRGRELPRLASPLTAFRSGLI